ncbi:MAG: hypothetical protein R3F19_03340 [Verrucomicrobiales bacterium]
MSDLESAERAEMETLIIAQFVKRSLYIIQAMKKQVAPVCIGIFIGLTCSVWLPIPARLAAASHGRPATPQLEEHGGASDQSMSTLTVDDLASRLGDAEYVIEVLRRQLRASSDPKKFLTDALEQLSDRMLAVEVAEKLGGEISLKDAITIAAESGNANSLVSIGLLRGAIICGIPRDGKSGLEAVGELDSEMKEIFLSFAQGIFAKAYPADAAHMIANGEMPPEDRVIAEILGASPKDFEANLAIFAGMLPEPVGPDSARHWMPANQEEVFKFIYEDQANLKSATTKIEQLGGREAVDAFNVFAADRILKAQGWDWIKGLITIRSKLCHSTPRGLFGLLRCRDKRPRSKLERSSNFYPVTTWGLRGISG